MTLVGQLFKLGVQVANAVVVTKTGQMKFELMKMKKAEQMETEAKREIAIKVEAVDVEKFLEVFKPLQLIAKDSKAKIFPSSIGSQ